MNALFLHFNEDGTIRAASVRINGAKVPDIEIWEVFELYNTLCAMGYRPIKMTYRDGTPVHMINY